MARYDSYKPSQIPWLNDIPSHWERKTLSQLTSEHKMSNKGVNHQNLLSLSYGRIVRKDINKTDGLLPASFEGYQIIEPGNIVLRLTDLQNDQKSLRVGLCHEEGIVTSAYVAIEPKPQYNPEYLYLLLHSYDILKVFYSMGGGIRQGLNYQGLSKIGVLLPPLEEQTKIVDFLSKKTALIESQQQEREREIQLLNELKQAEIANVVLRGLNPDAPTKEAQTIQFGKIPAHWEERKIQYCFSERSQKGFPNEPMLCATQSQGVIPQSMYANRVVVVNKDFDKQKLVKVGDFVISLRSFEGGIEYAYYQGIISAAYTILTPKEVENSEYFKHLFKSFNFIQLLQTCVTGIREGQNINYPFLSKHFIPVPPIEEQEAIVGYIRKKNSAIDDMIANLRAEIDTLTEYKQRLIADVVTGQVDVRNL